MFREQGDGIQPVDSEDRMLQMPVVPAADVGHARPRAIHTSVPWLIGATGAVVGFAASWIPSYWGDEAASVMSAERSWSSLAGMLGTIDAVHGLYYALLHLWVTAFGSTEFATRLPSAIAAGLMVAGVVVLVRDLADDRTAIMAGIVAVILPRTTAMAAEARSYALGAAAGVWLTVLLLRLLRRRTGSRGWIGYAFGAAACMYLFLYLGLLLIVHGLYIALVRRDRLATWSLSAATTLLLAVPIIVLGYQQRSQIAFLARRDYATARNVLVSQWFGQPLVAIMGWTLIVVVSGAFVTVLIRGGAKGLEQHALAALALLWLIVPSTVLLAGNVVSPMYNVRYLSFCAPAAAILIALGTEVAARRLAPYPRRIVPSALVAALMLACVPVYLGQRTPWAKDGGSDWQAVAQYVATNAHGGGAVIFDQATKPSRDPRIMISLYPDAFNGLQDLALTTPYSERSHLWDAVTPNAVAIARTPRASDVWAVELPSHTGRPADITMLLHDGFQIESAHLLHRTTVYHLTKE